MNFIQNAQKKFNKGAEEHTDQGWDDMAQVTLLNEAMDELLDLYNYMSHKKTRRLHFSDKARLVAHNLYTDIYTYLEVTGQENKHK